MNTVTAYNFSDAASEAYGDNLIQVDPGIYAVYSADINQDDNVDLLDLSLLEYDIINYEYGYFATDINGDGNVDLLDAPMLENNLVNYIYSMRP